jgi:hypothetical protein
MEHAVDKSKQTGREPKAVPRTRSTTNVEPGAHPVLQLQQQAGNQAMQQLLRSGMIQAKLAISQPGDPEEQEADATADRIMRSHAGVVVAATPCSCGTDGEAMCDECRQQSAGISRKATESGPARGSHRVLDIIKRSSGHPLDAATRGFFEPHFGRDFSNVRIHTDATASASARSIQARAFAAGGDIFFGAGQYAPDSEAGKRLLAHELTHVAQKENGSEASIIHRDLDPRLSITMTPEYAQDLSDEELANEEAALSARLSEIDEDAADEWLDDSNSPSPGPNVSPEWDAVAGNLKILRAEKGRRKSGLVQGIGEMLRPAGLPMNQGFQLQDAPPEFQALAAQIPEGRLINVVMMPTVGKNTGPQPSKYTSPLNAAGVAANASINSQVMTQGFAAAGENSIVIVAIPRAGTAGAMVPESMTLWGHTAVGARVDGQLTTVRGLTPESMFDVVRDYSGVRIGTSAVPSTISNDLSLMKNTGALTLEYPVSRGVAEALALGLPVPGPVGGAGPMYTAVPARFGNVCTGQNCVLWATQQAEDALGGRIGPVGGPPIADVPQVGQGGQGQLIRFMRNVAEGTEEAAPVENAIGPAVASGMSTGFKILKVGGRIFFVASLVMIPVETALAPEGERERTFVGATGGFVGGFGAGAVAGLICGPGALVCSLVLGLGFGIAGSIGGRKLAEGAYDLAEDVGRMTPAEWIDTTTLMFGTPEQKRAMCDFREIENPNDDGYDPMCGKL